MSDEVLASNGPSGPTNYPGVVNNTATSLPTEESRAPQDDVYQPLPNESVGISSVHTAAEGIKTPTGNCQNGSRDKSLEEYEHRRCLEETSNLKGRIELLEQHVASLCDFLPTADREPEQTKPVEEQIPMVSASIHAASAEMKSKIIQSLPLETLSSPNTDIEVCDTEETFFHRKHSVYMIEILQQSSDSRNSKRSVSRLVGSPTNSASAVVPSAMPSRIRIRSALILGLLEVVSKTELYTKADPTAANPAPAPVSLVFLYPFKLFVRHYAAIIGYIEKIMDGSAETSGNGQPTKFEVPSIPSQLQSAEAREHFGLLKRLFEENLGYLFTIRRELRDHTRTTVEFEHLWLLFDLGDIVYEREANDNPLGVPRLWKITHYGGGREILNDNAPDITDPFIKDATPKANSKGKENPFHIRGFYLESSGKAIFTEEDGYTIPPWDGERPVHELKLFPYHFCEPGRDFTDENRGAWLKRLVKEGRTYSTLRPGKVVYLKGIGVGEDLKMSEYQSQVVIDFEQAQVEAPKLSQTSSEQKLGALAVLMRSLRSRSSRSLFIHSGDTREVEETPQRVSAEAQTLKILDTIHNDNLLDLEYFRSEMKNIAPPLTAFNTAEASQIPLQNYILFPRTASGFVLSAREWVNFEIRDLSKVHFNKSLWKELQLPYGYKRALLATVRSHVRAKDSLPEHDSIPGKGTGAIILLQGSSGVGKTFTAEALAAHTNRPLYSITSGDLGDSVSTVERQLVKILNRGRRWGCVILLDEADVYLTRRGQDSFQRNAIVSAFLRQLERYPGIMVLTTNRQLNIDEAIAQRFQLRLFYPPLNKEAVKKVWALYCTKEKCQQLIADRVAKKPKVEIGEGVDTWWETPYQQSIAPKQTDHNLGASLGPNDEDEPQAWWSGRDIQFAFREAIALAVHDKVTEKRAHAKTMSAEAMEKAAKMDKKGKSGRKEVLQKQAMEVQKNSRTISEDDEILITKEYFDEVLLRLASFDEGIKTMHDPHRDGDSIGVEAPDESLQYPNDESYETTMTDSDVSPYDSDSSDEGENYSW
ncbi:uncharacterized protein PAC_17733 [Phialocephala subalpina]|uniref:AAA+ ATPase domain-containing protein n=1 Tax=Phialocephala subalpina TaxID=576137 RepID=A0A1L7XS07_9HELO|nr:uncharacterized protein PAC_17733 [Phialocephala subalpina]